ncbi:hypothetical protein HDU96_009080 [Phlyctochytrium bullatum]|nr:hypothetical protein HDU96_009080 [Phlyctochytrium bullatum]
MHDSARVDLTSNTTTMPPLDPDEEARIDSRIHLQDYPPYPPVLPSRRLTRYRRWSMAAASPFVGYEPREADRTSGLFHAPPTTPDSTSIGYPPLFSTLTSPSMTPLTAYRQPYSHPTADITTTPPHIATHSVPDLAYMSRRSPPTADMDTDSCGTPPPPSPSSIATISASHQPSPPPSEAMNASPESKPGKYVVEVAPYDDLLHHPSSGIASEFSGLCVTTTLVEPAPFPGSPAAQDDLDATSCECSSCMPDDPIDGSSTRTHRGVAPLPVDVVANVFEFLRDDSRTLASASLVSKSWHDLANASLWDSPPAASLKEVMLCLANARQQRLIRIASAASAANGFDLLVPPYTCPSIPADTPPRQPTTPPVSTLSVHLPWPARYIRHLTFPTVPDPFLVSSSFAISLLAVRLAPQPSTALRSLSIPNVDAIPARFVLLLLQASPMLASLHLGGMDANDALMAHVPALCPRLVHVRLTGTAVTARGVVELVSRLPLGIERLDLDRVDDADGWHRALPLVPLARWDRLQSLSVHFCGIKAKLVLAILAAGGGPNLETINVGNLTTLHHPPTPTPSSSGIHPFDTPPSLPTPELDAAAVEEIRLRCPKLRDVCFNDLDEGMTVAVAVNCGARLRSLKLCNVGNLLTDEGLLRVAATCPNLSVLRIVFGGPAPLPPTEETPAIVEVTDDAPPPEPMELQAPACPAPQACTSASRPLHHHYHYRHQHHHCHRHYHPYRPPRSAPRPASSHSSETTLVASPPASVCPPPFLDDVMGVAPEVPLTPASTLSRSDDDEAGSEGGDGTGFTSVSASMTVSNSHFHDHDHGAGEGEERRRREGAEGLLKLAGWTAEDAAEGCSACCRRGRRAVRGVRPRSRSPSLVEHTEVPTTETLPPSVSSSPTIVPDVPIPTPPPSTLSVTDRSLIAIVTQCRRLIEFGCVGHGAPVSRRLLDAIVSSPCGRTLRRLNFAGSSMSPREFLGAVEHAAYAARVARDDANPVDDSDAGTTWVLPSLVFLEMPWVYGRGGGWSSKGAEDEGWPATAINDDTPVHLHHDHQHHHHHAVTTSSSTVTTTRDTYMDDGGDADSERSSDDDEAVMGEAPIPRRREKGKEAAGAACARCSRRRAKRASPSRSGRKRATRSPLHTTHTHHHRQHHATPAGVGCRHAGSRGGRGPATTTTTTTTVTTATMTTCTWTREPWLLPMEVAALVRFFRDLRLLDIRRRAASSVAAPATALGTSAEVAGGTLQYSVGVVERMVNGRGLEVDVIMGTCDVEEGV